MASTSQHSLNITSGERAPLGHSIMILLSLHTFMFGFIAVLGVYLQLKFQVVSPYEVVYTKVMMDLVIIVTCIYIVSLVVMGILAARGHIEFEDVMNKISLLLGSLSLISELIVLISPFGWIVFFFWIICLFCFMSESYRELKKLHESAVAHLLQFFRELKQTLTDWRNYLMASNVEANNPDIRNEKLATDLEAQDHNQTDKLSS